MKKALGVVACAAVLVSSLPLTVSAETDYKGVKLPFEVTAPANVALANTGDGDSLTTLNVTWSMNDAMCKWMSEEADPNTYDAVREKLLKDYGLEDLIITTQIDWAIDDPVNGWHWTKYWDGEEWVDDDGNKQWAGWGHDKDYQSRVSDWDVTECLTYPKTVNDCWILRGNTISEDPALDKEELKNRNEWFDGNDLIPGVKNQLKPDQYTLVDTDPEAHEKAIKIDWTQHTAYVRVRFALNAYDKDGKNTPIFSDWSESAGFGKDAEVFVPYTKETLAAPAISGLRYYPDDFNGYPQVAVTLTVPEELSKNLTNITARGGGIRVEWEARVPGGTWYGQQGDGTVTAGENIVSLIFLAENLMRENSENGVSTPDVILAKDSPLELRARYWISQYESYSGEYLGEFYTDYSEVLTFGAQEMSKPKEVSVVESTAEEASEVITPKQEEISQPAPQKTEKKSMLWLWILLIILLIIIIIVVIIIIIVSKKKKKDNNQNPPAGGAPMSTEVNPVVNVDPNNQQ